MGVDELIKWTLRDATERVWAKRLAN